MPESLIPFHQQAEEVGNFVLLDRARDAYRRRSEQRPEGPSENTD
jgi:hypothetical protein